MRLALAVAAFVAVAGLSVQAAFAGGPLQTGFVETEAFRGPDANLAYARARYAGATTIRIVASWAAIAPSASAPGGDPRDPDNPDYNWSTLDDSVNRAVTNKLTPIVDVVGAPRWAWGTTTSQAPGPGAIRPSPTALGSFAAAAAERYGGRTDGLPRVKYWMLWNEPNLSTNLKPQLEDGRLISASWYRQMTNAFYTAVHAAKADNVVIAGGQAPFGSNNDFNVGTSPLPFMRDLMCMSAGDRPHPTCNATVHFDIWGHHPYTSGGPTHKAQKPGDVSIGDLPAMKRLLDAAIRAHHVVSKQKVRFWVTEFSWDSQPADPKGVPARLNARWVSEGLYRMWLSGVSLVTWFNLRDDPFTPDTFCQCGLWLRGTGGLATDKPKLSLQAFRFPFAAFIRRNGTTSFWGRTPDSKPKALVIEQRSTHGWVRVSSVKSGANGIFAGAITGPRSKTAMMRARIVAGSDASVPFSLKRPPDVPLCPFGTCS